MDNVLLTATESSEKYSRNFEQDYDLKEIALDFEEGCLEKLNTLTFESIALTKTKSTSGSVETNDTFSNGISPFSSYKEIKINHKTDKKSGGTFKPLQILEFIKSRRD